MPQLTIEVLETPRALDALRPAWSALVDRAGFGGPFHGPEWLLAWWRRFGRGRPFVIVGWDGARLAGVAPLFFEPVADEAVRLAFLGVGITDEHGLLVERQHGAAFADGVLACIARHRGEWDRAELEHLAPDDPLLAASRPAGVAVSQAQHEACLAGPLAGWRDRIGRTISRELCGRAARRLSRRGTATFDIAREGTVAEFLDALFALHRQGGLDAPGMRAFHHDAARGLLGRGWLRLHGLRLDGRLVAVLYALLHRGRLRAYLSGFDEELADVSPGTLLLGRALQHAESEGASDFDLLRGREPYKYRWGAQERWQSRLTLG